jgi:hypothetical protein
VLPTVEPTTTLTAAALPVAKPTRCFREQTTCYKPESVIRSKSRKSRGKTTKNDIYILGFYAVSIADNIKPIRPRRDRMQFAYRYVVDGKEEDDYNWVTLNDMLVHPEEEQFVGYLYELLATHIGDVVNDLKTPVMQGADLLNKRSKK